MKILYHANCNDGLASALAVWMEFREALPGGEKVNYIPVNYGDPIPQGVDWEWVIIVDFTYPREQLIQLAQTASQITVIDHHRGSEDIFSNPFPSVNGDISLCDIEVIFDTGKCGAMLTWERFCKDDPPPVLFEYIQDRDLWRYRFPETKPVHYALKVMPDFRNWLSFIRHPKLIDSMLVPQGKPVVAFIQEEVSKVVKTAKLAPFFNYKHIPTANCPPTLASDVGNELAINSPFSVTYWDDVSAGVRTYNLRSDKQGMDVSIVAKELGGGGHKHAAGFTVRGVRV